MVFQSPSLSDNSSAAVPRSEAGAILRRAFAASTADAPGYAQARSAAETMLAVVCEHPGQFATLAKTHSACSSASQGGNLGQIIAGQTTPEFERALFALEPGSIAPEPVATRYGFHIVRLDRKHEGRDLPFETRGRSDCRIPAGTRRATCARPIHRAARYRGAHRRDRTCWR